MCEHSAPEFEVIGELSAAAIEALAALLISVRDQEEEQPVEEEHRS